MNYQPLPRTSWAGATLVALGWFLWSGTGCSHRPTPTATSLGPVPKPTPKHEVLVQVLKPPVFWRSDAKDELGQEIAPDPDPTKPQWLPAGAWVRCGPGGEVKIYETPDIAVHKGPEWRPLPHLTKPQEELVNEAKAGLFLRAGRSRDLRPEVFSPQKDSLVWPAALVFRWPHGRAGKKIRLALRETAKKEELWEKSGLDSGPGRYEDPEARATLQHWRNMNKGGGTGRLTFVLQDNEGIAGVLFDVLTIEAEKDLESALARWDAESKGVLRLLGRAQVLYERHLLTESVAAYEDALKADPRDPWIRRRTAEAYRLIGDKEGALLLETKKDRP